jgi:hypothetical protein
MTTLRHAILITCLLIIGATSSIASINTPLLGKPCNQADTKTTCVRNRAVANAPPNVINPSINDVSNNEAYVDRISVDVIWTPSNWAETRVKLQYGDSADNLNKELPYQEGVTSGTRQNNSFDIPNPVQGKKVFYRVVLDWYAVEDFVPKVVSKVGSIKLKEGVLINLSSNENNATLRFVCVRGRLFDSPLSVVFTTSLGGDGFTKPFTIKYDNDAKLH